MTEPRCAVGLLTWNGERDVARCVRSLLAQTESPIELCWIDNASSDRTIDVVRAEAPGVFEPIAMRENVGFCEGHNRGLASTRAPYYLALNQDVELAPDYIERLCDWMDTHAEVAMVSGLILAGEMPEHEPERALDGATIYSAGLAMGRGRFPFELKMGQPASEADGERRYVPGVTGAAMLLRRSAVQAASLSPDQVFPREFFAYFEEVDLALRLARAGWRCGVDGAAVAWHAARGQGGAGNRALRAHYLKNHWLVSLRNDTWGDMFGEAAYILKGEIKHYCGQYLRNPGAALSAMWRMLRLCKASRRDFHRLEKQFSHSREGRARFYAESIRLLRSEARGLNRQDAEDAKK